MKYKTEFDKKRLIFEFEVIDFKCSRVCKVDIKQLFTSRVTDCQIDGVFGDLFCRVMKRFLVNMGTFITLLKSFMWIIESTNMTHYILWKLTEDICFLYVTGIILIIGCILPILNTEKKKKKNQFKHSHRKKDRRKKQEADDGTILGNHVLLTCIHTLQILMAMVWLKIFKFWNPWIYALENIFHLVFSLICDRSYYMLT